MIQSVKVLGENIKVVARPQQGAFEPDYEAFYKDLSEKSVEVKKGNVVINISAHFDFNVVVTIRIKSLGGLRYGFDYMLDRDDIYELNNEDKKLIDHKIIGAFKDVPEVKCLLIKHVNDLDYG